MSDPIATEESVPDVVDVIHDDVENVEDELERRRAYWRAAKDPFGRACLVLGLVLLVVVIACAVASSLFGSAR